MADEPRYDDAEVKRILELATRPAPDAARLRPAEGMSLSEVKEIGAQAGIDPEAIARAAAALDAGEPRPPRRSLGMPIEVGRIVGLPRALTDREWEELVGDLRATFRAQGQVSTVGSTREWRNGNLHAVVEPATRGYRLRLGTYKGDATGINAIGATGIAAGAITAASMVAAGDVHGALMIAPFFGGAGVMAFLSNMLRLPRWADRRARQMERIAERALQITRTSLPGSDAPDDSA